MCFAEVGALILRIRSARELKYFKNVYQFIHRTIKQSSVINPHICLGKVLNGNYFKHD